MSNVTISCPYCGFSRQIPYDKVPDGPRKVTCPKCQETFIYTRPEEAPVTESSGVSPISKETSVAPQGGQSADAANETNTDSFAELRSRPVPPLMTDIGELFQESWTIFKSRFATLIGLCLLGIAGFIAPILLAGGLASMTTAGGGIFVSLIALGVLVGFLCGIWCLGGLLCAVVDDGLNLKGALQKGKGIILSLTWISILSAFIICGGYLLLIIPGIIFSVWFVFGQFLLVEDEARGMGALLKSREYVRGQWFNVAIRLLLIWAVSGIISAIPLAGPFLSLAFFPYVMIFQYLIFRNLRQIKGEIPYPCGVGNKLVWPAVSLLGLIVVPALVISLAGFSVFGALSLLAPLAKGKIMQSTQAPEAIPPLASPLAPVEPGLPGIGGSPETNPTSPTDASGALSSDEIPPESISVFIYAVNYTGEVRVNGTVVQKLEGEPDMQYNYNLNGKSFRNGQNRVVVDFAELPNPPSTMLEIHLRVSRSLQDGQKVVLGEWRINEKGTGSRIFEFEIPK
ncbi:MAG: hypothetical protein EG822_02640 [Deltaproteobacteria bacterium]|nr:hypothetical protein [Deltaproteobacteria bacterium]TLN02010.1 MAG: hypothetical protein FDZ73_13625 [bacterium]